jgi:hypothetical protein
MYLCVKDIDFDCFYEVSIGCWLFLRGFYWILTISTRFLLDFDCFYEVSIEFWLFLRGFYWILTVSTRFPLDFDCFYEVSIRFWLFLRGFYWILLRQCGYFLFIFIMLLRKVRENLRGSQKWTIHRHWQREVQNTERRQTK